MYWHCKYELMNKVSEADFSSFDDAFNRFNNVVKSGECQWAIVYEDDHDDNTKYVRAWFTGDEYNRHDVDIDFGSLIYAA